MAFSIFQLSFTAICLAIMIAIVMIAEHTSSYTSADSGRIRGYPMSYRAAEHVEAYYEEDTDLELPVEIWQSNEENPLQDDEPLLQSDEPLLQSDELAVQTTTDAEESPLGPRHRKKFAFFLHIHKAGGSTMCYVARFNHERSYGGNCNAAGRYSRLNFAQGTEERVNNILERFVKKSHLTFVADEWMITDTLPKRENVTYLTILRNPLARTESHYAMAMQQAKSRLKHDLKTWQCKFAEGVPTPDQIDSQNENLDVAAAARTYFVQTTPDNWQTRAVCGPACVPVPYGHLTKEHLAIAKQRLREDFDVVGILEHFPETMMLMHDHLQWKKDAAVEFGTHKGTNHSGLTVLQRIEERSAGQPELLEFAKWFHATNQLDIELYNYGRTLFKAQAASRGISVDLGPDVQLDFVSPNQRTTPSAELKGMLAAYVEEKGCTTQCCSEKCGPIGYYWYRTAEMLKMVPWRKHCG